MLAPGAVKKGVKCFKEVMRSVSWNLLLPPGIPFFQCLSLVFSESTPLRLSWNA